MSQVKVSYELKRQWKFLG